MGIAVLGVLLLMLMGLRMGLPLLFHEKTSIDQARYEEAYAAFLRAQPPAPEQEDAEEESSRITTAYVININTADSVSLMSLNGFTPEAVHQILAYRRTHGNFTSISELQGLNGITQRHLATISAHCTIDTATMH
ncbi:MAG: helix-hairpin-helix domain-containing protein [Chitinophagia bacterium]|nr:helix-hairpin-helix domain-containing protein [Chitinophagia bacterium]